MKGGVSLGGPPLKKKIELSSPRKRDFRHSEAKRACFNISFYKVNIPFFFFIKI